MTITPIFITNIIILYTNILYTKKLNHKKLEEVQKDWKKYMQPQDLKALDTGWIKPLKVLTQWTVQTAPSL